MEAGPRREPLDWPDGVLRGWKDSHGQPLSYHLGGPAGTGRLWQGQHLAEGAYALQRELHWTREPHARQIWVAHRLALHHQRAIRGQRAAHL